MSRFECLGKSCTVSQKQLAEAPSSNADRHRRNEKEGKSAASSKPSWSPPASIPTSSKQVSQKQTAISCFPSRDRLTDDGCHQKNPVKITPRVREQTQRTAGTHDYEPNKDGRSITVKTDSTKTRGVHHVPSQVKHHHRNGKEEGDKGEDIKVPVELKIKFLRAVRERDLELACKLCQMILIFEPDNPEASEFLPLIKKKLLEEQEAEQSSEEDEEDDEDDENSDDSGNDEESSESLSSSSSSCSSFSPSDNEEEEEEKAGEQTQTKPSL